MEEVEVVCGCSKCEATQQGSIKISGNNRVLDFVTYISKVAKKSSIDGVGEKPEE